MINLRLPFSMKKTDDRYRRGALNRKQRLTRWAEVLARDPHKSLHLLPVTRCLSASERAALDTKGSALEAAYYDPILRLDGLTGASVEEIMLFFQLSDQDADRIFSNHRRNTVRSAYYTSIRVKNVADKRREYRYVAILLALSIAVAALLGSLY